MKLVGGIRQAPHSLRRPGWRTEALFQLLVPSALSFYGNSVLPLFLDCFYWQQLCFHIDKGHHWLPVTEFGFGVCACSCV